MEILKIFLEEQLLIKYYVAQQLILLKIQNMTDMNLEFLEWFVNCFDKKTALLIDKSASNTNKGTGINSGIVSENKDLAKDYTNKLLKK